MPVDSIADLSEERMSQDNERGQRLIRLHLQ